MKWNFAARNKDNTNPSQRGILHTGSEKKSKQIIIKTPNIYFK
jgi:hypothetical protein